MEFKRNAIINAEQDTHKTIYDVSPHQHNHYEIVYYISGDGSIVINDKEYHFTSNSFSISKPGVTHREYSKNNVSLIYIGFSLENNEELLKNGVFTCPRGVHLLSTLKEIKFEYDQKASYKKERLNHLLESMIILIKRSIMMTKSKSNEMEDVIKYIKGNISKNINGLTIAKHFSYNYDYFRKTFKNYYKTSINDFINHEKVEYGRTLLKKTDMSIEDIAIKCGYKSTSHFISVFKSIYNTTPKQFLLNYDKHAEKK